MVIILSKDPRGNPNVISNRFTGIVLQSHFSMKRKISKPPRGNSSMTVNRCTGIPDKFMFIIGSKPQQKPAKMQWSNIILLNKYGLQDQIKIRKNSEFASTSQLVEERYKDKLEAIFLNRFSLTRAFSTFYKYRD